MTESSVTEFRRQQALQEQAAQQGLTGLAIVASYASINARMERDAKHMLQLISEGKQQEVLVLLETQGWGTSEDEPGAPHHEH